MKRLLTSLIVALGGDLKGRQGAFVAGGGVVAGMPRKLKLQEVIPYVNSVLLESLGHELVDIYEFLYKILGNVIEIKKHVESIR